MGKIFLAAITSVVLLVVTAKAADSTSMIEVRPRIYLTTADVTRLRQQASRPELAAAYADLEAKTKKLVADWRKKYPATATPRTTGELMEIGKHNDPWFGDIKTIATAFALHPTPELGQVLREKIITRVGARQINNYWREGGIHEGETAMVFLRSYDLITQTGLLTGDDEKVIKEALHRCAHHLEGWTLDNEFSSPGWVGSPIYCLNFHTFSKSCLVVGAIQTDA